MYLTKGRKRILAVFMCLVMCMFNISYAMVLTVPGQTTVITGTNDVIKDPDEPDITTLAAMKVEIIDVNTEIKGTLDEKGKGHLYKFSIDTPSKLAIIVNTDETLDASFYFYDSKLKKIAVSKHKGAEIEEKLNNMAQPGEYYVFINNNSGKGNYVAEVYASTKDIAYELNENTYGAYSVSNNFAITGVIDNPRDVDVYRTYFPVTAAINIKLLDNSGNEYSVYATKDGKNFIDATTNNVIQLPESGQWYFYVRSSNGKCSSDKTYTLRCTIIKKTRIEITGYQGGSRESLTWSGPKSL